MEEIREILKLDKVTMFVIIFWSAIFVITGYIFFALALPQIGQLIITSLFLYYFVIRLLVSSLGETKLCTAIFKLTVFFLIGPLITFTGISVFSNIIIKTLISKSVAIILISIVGILTPHSILVFLLVTAKFRRSIIESRKRLKLSTSLSVATVTILYTLLPLLALSPVNNQLLVLFLLLPFGANLFTISIIEFYELALSERDENTSMYGT